MSTYSGGGVPGVNGSDGSDGAQGDQGIQGIQGIQGDQGASGESAVLSDEVPQATGLLGVAGSGNKAARDDHEHVGPIIPLPAKGAGADWSSFILPGWGCRVLSVSSVSANEMYATPIYIAKRWTFDKIRLKVTTPQAGKLARMGIYAAVPNNAGLALGGAALILDAGTVSCTSTGSKEIAINVTLDPGWYFVVLVADDGGLAFESFSTSTETVPMTGRMTSGDGAPDDYTFYLSAGVMGTPVVSGLPDPCPDVSGLYPAYKAGYVRLQTKATL